MTKELARRVERGDGAAVARSGGFYRGMDRPTVSLLTYPEAARVLGVSRKTVQRLVQTKQLPVVQIRSAVRIDPADLDHYIAEHRSAAEPKVRSGAMRPVSGRARTLVPVSGHRPGSMVR